MKESIGLAEVIDVSRKECREMGWLEQGKISYVCPDCGCRCSAILMKPGLEVCNACQTIAMKPDDKERWTPYLPMKADYEIHEDGTKKLLGWHPESQPEECFSKVTGKEACELISKYLKEAKGMDVKPEDIWNYSPTGELAEVFLLYEEAKEYFAALKVEGGDVDGKTHEK